MDSDPVSYKRHIWQEDIDFHMHTCVRCGVRRKRKAHPYLTLRWNPEYYVDGKWTDEKPKCSLKP